MAHVPYSRSAAVYDLLYSFKDYAAEAEKLAAILRREIPAGREILDVACGTAEHARFLVGQPIDESASAGSTPRFLVDGIDLEPQFVEIARTKVPTGHFVVGDMSSFYLERRYDAVLCLFSAIGYLLEQDRLTSALRCFRRHLHSGGIILVEPWFTPEEWRDGSIHMQTAATDEIKVCRMCVSGREGSVSIMPFCYMAATHNGVENFTEEHRMALRTVDEMLAAFDDAGLNARFDLEGITGRGLYIAREATLR